MREIIHARMKVMDLAVTYKKNAGRRQYDTHTIYIDHFSVSMREMKLRMK